MKGLMMAICGSMIVTFGADRTGLFSGLAALVACVGFARCAAYWRRISPKLGLPSFLGCFFMGFHFWMGVVLRFGYKPDPSAPMMLAMVTTIVMISLFRRVDQPVA